jgi:hypothetical protein
MLYNASEVEMLDGVPVSNWSVCVYYCFVNSRLYDMSLYLYKTLRYNYIELIKFVTLLHICFRDYCVLVFILQVIPIN